MTRKLLIIPGTAMVLLLIVAGCAYDFIPRESSLIITSANVYYKNPETGAEVARALIHTNAHIIVAVEVTEDNIDTALLEEAGYRAAFYYPSSSYKGIAIFTRLPGEGALIPIDDFSPGASLRFMYNNTPFSIIGLHIPAPFYFPEEDRIYVLNRVGSWLEAGYIKSPIGSALPGDTVLLAGDFNCFPDDRIMKPIFDGGLVDSHTADSHGTNNTWRPYDFVPHIARIDYIFASNTVNFTFSGTFSIPGSDHRGVTAGISIK